MQQEASHQEGQAASALLHRSAAWPHPAAGPPRRGGAAEPCASGDCPSGRRPQSPNRATALKAPRSRQRPLQPVLSGLGQSEFFSACQGAPSSPAGPPQPGSGCWRRIASAAGPAPRLGRRRNEEEATVGARRSPAPPPGPPGDRGRLPAGWQERPSLHRASPLSRRPRRLPPPSAPAPLLSTAGPRSSPQIDVPLPLPAAVLGRRHVGRLQGARADC